MAFTDDSTKLLVAVKAYARGNALPLDNSEVYATKAEAESYAASATAYAGQTIKVLENGIIVGLNSDAEVVNYAADTCAQACLVMNDELSVSPLEGLDQYCEVFEDDVTYPRVLPLYVGDSFTTNNYKGTEADAKYAKVDCGKLELQAAADGDTLFTVKVATLPAGQKAYHFVYVGKVAA